ncbi:MAG: T9SS type B sorting domain-containing protein, partial [Flavobacteriaceae bacterium]
YVYAETGTTPNCFDEHSFVVTISATPVVDTPADVTMCDSYTLPALTTGTYYTGAGGTGTVLNAGDAITSTQTIYVYAETGTTPNCFDEHSFVVTIGVTPTVDTPSDVTICDSYTLPVLTTGTYYTGTGGTGTVLNAGDAITSTQTIYVYAETGTTPNCFDEHSFVVTISATPVVDTPADVTMCDSYTLPALTTGTYYTGAGGTGTVLNAGDAITSTQTIYVYAETGTTPNCFDEHSFVVTIGVTPTVDAPSDVTICDSYTLPALTNGGYYTGPGGTGTMLNAGDAITSTQTIYVYEETGTTPNCFDENSFVVTINATPTVDAPSDVTICNEYILPALTSGTYYTGAGGTGTVLNAGDVLTTSQTIYVYEETGTTPNCFDEHSFVLTINVCTISVSVTADTPSICSTTGADVTLTATPTPGTAIGTYSYSWTVQGNATVLGTANTLLLSPPPAVTTTYEVTLTDSGLTPPNDTVTNTVTVVVNTTPSVDAPADVTMCDSYILPALTSGTYYTGAGGTGTVLSVGSAITSTQTIYVYGETGTTPNCTDENSFVVTINPTPSVDAPSDVTICGSYTLPALTNGTYYTGAGGTGAVLNAGDVITTTQTIYVYEETGTTPNCFDENSFVVTINTTPTVDAPANVTMCDSYILPALTNGTYYTGAGGTGSVLTAGSAVTSTQTIYVYGETGTTPNCTDENSFMVTINTTPSVDAPSDVEMCGSYTLPALTNGTYYTGTGGTGAVLNAGDVITSTQTIYVYAETGTTPNCFDENSFVVTINFTPNVDAPSDVTMCDSYILPALTTGTYYTGAGGTGSVLTAGSAITSTQTIYVYGETGTTPNCSDENSFVVTINTTPTVDTPADVTMCDSYTLPVLSTGTYYTGSGGTGTVLNAGDVLTTSQTIYVYAETGTTPNCSDEHSFVVTINATPTVDTPADITICDSYTLPTLTTGSYYTGTGGTGIALAEGTVITSTQTIYVYEETGTTPNCSDEHSFVVTINITPTVDTPTDVEMCDSYTLQALTNGTYYTGAGGTGTVLNAGDVITSTQTIYVYAETGTTPNCSSEHSFVVTVNPSPTATAIDDLEECDVDINGNPDNDGIVVFNLTTHSGVLLNGQANMTVSYFLNQADADANVNSLTSQGFDVTAYASGSQEIFVRVEDVLTGCYNTSVSFELIVNTINAVPPTDLYVCDDDNDGHSFFDLESVTAQIQNGNTALVVTYYETPEQAELGAGANIDTSDLYVNLDVDYNNDGVFDPQIIYIRVDDAAGTGCSYYGNGLTLTLNVLNSPDLSDNDFVYALCEDNNSSDGYVMFNLLDYAHNDIGIDPTLDIRFFENLDAAGEPINEIFNVSSYTNIVTPDQVIYMSVSNTSMDSNGNNCTTVREITLHVGLLPNIANPYPIVECDDDYYDDMDGMYPFDLDAHVEFITGGITGLEVEFYETQADALIGSGPSLITNTSAYLNTIYAGAQDIFARVIDPTSGCAKVILVALKVQPNPTPLRDSYIRTQLGNRGVMEECDGNVDGSGAIEEQVAEFDLTLWETQILTGDGQGVESGVSAAYYTSYEDAELGDQANAITTPEAYTNTSNPQTIFVRVTNDGTGIIPETDGSGCYTIVRFYIYVPVPEVSIEGNAVLCVDENGLPLTNSTLPVLTAVTDSAAYDFQWSLNGVDIPGATESTYTVTQAGEYTVTISGPSDFDCINYATTTIVESGVPDGFDANVTTTAFANDHQIQAEATSNIPGITFYYTLDLDPNTGEGVETNLTGLFTDVTPGYHTVTITDGFGCWSDTVDVLVIDYPHFFTPNGDGVNDTWKIIGQEGIPISIIYIFDRYGKLLKQIDPDGAGWDGTYNGHLMPAGDYWFTIKYIEGAVVPSEKDFKAHFSLKR